jgi:DNA-binding winged helix-turn-helix (wHTH) protein/TolB-like protein
MEQPKQKQGFWEFGDFRIDLENRLLLQRNEIVALQPKTFDLLLLLVENNGRVLTKDELMKRVWPDAIVEESNLTQNIYILRKIFSTDPKGQKYIETLPKRGYRFAISGNELQFRKSAPPSKPLPDLPENPDNKVLSFPVGNEITRQQQLAVGAEGLSAESRVGHGKHKVLDREYPSLQAPPEAKPSLRQRKISGLQLGAIGLLIVGLLAGSYLLFKPRQAAQKPIRSIAVLPFTVLASNNSDTLLGIGIADDLVTRLSKTKQLVVRPTSTVLVYTGKEQDPAAIGRALAVDAVLLGSVRQLDDQIRVNAQLIAVGDGKPLWAETFGEKAADIFTLQDRISEHLSQAMTLELNGEERRQLTKHYTDNFEAFQLYQRGALAMRKRTREGFDSAIGYFQQAVNQDAGYALAYVGMATAYTLQNLFGFTPAREAMPKAEKLLKKALEMDETIAQAHSALAMVKAQYDWNFPEAEKELRRAIELSPNLMEVHQYYALCLAAQQRFEESRKQLDIARQLDPNSQPLGGTAAWIDYLSGQYDATISSSQKLLEANPNFYLAYQYLGYAYLAKRMVEPAVSAFEKARLLSEDAPGTLALLGYAYGVADRKAEAQKMVDELRQKKAAAHFLAWVSIGMGEREQALDWLQKAYEERSSELIYLKASPIYEPLRSDPRFIELLARVGFAD